MRNRRYSRSRSPIQRKREKRSLDVASNGMVFLSNLPDIQWNQLKDLTRDTVGETAYVEFVEDHDGKQTGFAVLEFDTSRAANEFVKKIHRTKIHGNIVEAENIRSPLNFFRAFLLRENLNFMANRNVVNGRERNRHPESRKRGEEPRSPYDGAFGETYGLNPSFLEKLQITGPLVNRVFVTNIPDKCEVGQLYDAFSLAGRITSFDVKPSGDGKSGGMAQIQYSHPIEAVQAISMLDGKRFFRRTLTVKMDPVKKEELRPGQLPVGLSEIGMGLGAYGAPLTDIPAVFNHTAPPSYSTAPIPPLMQRPINPRSISPIPLMASSAPASAYPYDPYTSDNEY